MKVSYGEAGGTKTVRLVELFSPPQDPEPLLWCEIRFHKR